MPSRARRRCGIGLLERSAQGSVDPLESDRAGAKLARAELVERRLHRVQVFVKVFGVRVDVEETRHHLAGSGALLEVIHGVDTIGGVVLGGKLAQLGQRLVNGAAKKLADQFFQKFAENVSQSGASQAKTG